MKLNNVIFCFSNLGQALLPETTNIMLNFSNFQLKSLWSHQQGLCQVFCSIMGFFWKWFLRCLIIFCTPLKCDCSSCCQIYSLWIAKNPKKLSQTDLIRWLNREEIRNAPFSGFEQKSSWTYWQRKRWTSY